MDNDDRWTPSVKGDNPKEILSSINEVVKLIYQYLHILEGRVGPTEVRDDLSVNGDVEVGERLRILSLETAPDISEAGEFDIYYDEGDEELKKSNEVGAWEPLLPESPTEAARVWVSSNVSVNPTALTAVQFDTEVEDTGSFFNILSPRRLTIPTTGNYIFGASIVFSAIGDDDTEESRVEVWKNGTTPLAVAGAYSLKTMIDRVTTTGMASLTAADYLECYVYHDNVGGSPRDLSSISQDSPVFWIHRLS